MRLIVVWPICWGLLYAGVLTLASRFLSGWLLVLVAVVSLPICFVAGKFIADLVYAPFERQKRR
jgi:hypothetical protein